MNVQVGQVWEDADSRRAGRTFKIADIDDGMATCENLTGIGGTPPSKPTAFIKLERFKPKYYKLKRASGNSELADDLAKAMRYESDKDPGFISRAADEVCPYCGGDGYESASCGEIRLCSCQRKKPKLAGQQSPSYRPVSFQEVKVVRRKPKKELLKSCRNFWPGEWREVGPYVALCSRNNDFEVSIRELDEFSRPFEVRVKLYQFTIFQGTIRGDVIDALMKVQDFFLVLNHELSSFIVGESNE